MQEHLQQPYDTTLKALLREQAAEMIPYLVEEAEFVDTLCLDVSSAADDEGSQCIDVAGGYRRAETAL